MPQPDFFGFLAQAVEALKEQAPFAYRRFHAQFAPLRACLSPGDDTRTVWLDGDRLAIRDGVHDAAVRARFELATIDDLVDGRLTLLDALIGERLWLSGRPEHVERFFDAFTTFIIGSMRSHKMQALMAAFRGHRQPD
ncbi:hypothetical protein [Piscinibacter koreensis]|uniref:SCP2 domain-containing protein n=1 Tax=Piscinibacter koreensis TaxID=2742824 RepID=A0A7Y6NMJ6_9BURK|nr:hypothetical protein [Schlegelella koreensis]NUZ05907.1 hypothetical protein [Schlegelella koreensis]